jgi:hypothetical protein
MPPFIPDTLPISDTEKVYKVDQIPYARSITLNELHLEPLLATQLQPGCGEYQQPDWKDC